MTCIIFWVISWVKLQCFLILESVSYVSFILELHRDALDHEKHGLSESPSLPLSLVGAHLHHSEMDSSNLAPERPDHCWLTGLDLSFLSCPGLESEWSLCLLVKGSGWKLFHVPSVVLGRVGCAIVWGRKPWVFASSLGLLFTIVRLHWIFWIFTAFLLGPLILPPAVGFPPLPPWRVCYWVSELQSLLKEAVHATPKLVHEVTWCCGEKDFLCLTAMSFKERFM